MQLNDFIFSREQKIHIGRRIFFFQWLFNALFRPYNPRFLQYTSKVISGQNLCIIDDQSSNLQISLASSPGIYIQSRSKITIHSSVLLGPRVTIISSNHTKNNFQDFDDTEGTSIYIGKNVWIGANAVILPNVTIGSDCVIGAGAVVTKPIPSGTTCVGNPARAI